MECIKTGCHVYLPHYNEWAYGDAFELELSGGPGELVYVYVFRLCARELKPLRPVKHFTIHNIQHWFDEDRTSQIINSTLIATSVTDHGYEGVPL